MPGYTIKTLEEVPDVLGDYPGEMRMLTSELGAEQVALTYRRMPQHTGGKGSYGHRHDDAGGDLLRRSRASSSSSSSDEVIECGRGTAIRVAPEVVRSVWNDEPEDAELVIVSTRVDDPQGPSTRRTSGPSEPLRSSLAALVGGRRARAGAARRRRPRRRLVRRRATRCSAGSGPRR